ncbi:MAG: iron-sulfur cluster assembly protein [bacterium]|nr:iron-sulfur cluster assembly protein [bacterium]MDY2830818.1 iron-sulfur cluster assembly protein [Alphaproteobacteria bacterium]
MKEIREENSEDYKKDYVAKAGKPLPQGEVKASRDEVIDALKTVCDPEIMINIWDMGLVYKLEQKENGDVYIEMTVTSPMCPVAGVLPEQVAEAVAALDGVGEVEVRIVWEPAWSFEMLSDDAKAMFEVF